MGYYKNLEVEQQERADMLVRWYHANKDTLPPSVMSVLMEDIEQLERVAAMWDERELSQPVPPVPASAHVALNTPFYEEPKLKQSFIGWSLVSIAIVVSVIIVGVNL